MCMQADKTAAEAAAAEARDQAATLQSSLAQAQRQVDILSNNTDSKETQLQQLKDELNGANSAKMGLELQVGGVVGWCDKESVGCEVRMPCQGTHLTVLLGAMPVAVSLG
jgi:hypothetical protein